MNSNYNMFGKKRSIYSSSDNTQNKKILIFTTTEIILDLQPLKII